MEDEDMENKNSLKELINQTKRIDENNWNNAQYLNSISMMLASNDLGKTKDEDLSQRFEELNSKVEDINTLTSELLNYLSKKHN